MTNDSKDSSKGLSGISGQIPNTSNKKERGLRTRYKYTEGNMAEVPDSDNIIGANPGVLSSRYQIHHKDQKISQIKDQKLEKVALTHPKYTARSNRLDLITNDMLGIVARTNDKFYNVCDISRTGFSYAQEIAVNSAIGFEQIRKKIDNIATNNYGKTITSSIYFKGEEEKGEVNSTGTICNHMAFLGLLPEEIEREMNAYLYSRSIRRNKDPLAIFTKFDLLKEKAFKALEKNHWNTSLCIAMNTTVINLLREIGANSTVFNQIYNGYKNKQVFLKFGVSIKDENIARELFEFALNRGNINKSEPTSSENPSFQPIEKVPGDSFQDQSEEPVSGKIDLKLRNNRRFNKKYSYKNFLILLWKFSLKRFGLDKTLPIPVTQDVQIADNLKKDSDFYRNRLELIADLNNSYISKGTKDFLIEGLYWHLVAIDEKYFDKLLIQKELDIIIQHTYQACIKHVSNL